MTSTVPVRALAALASLLLALGARPLAGQTATRAFSFHFENDAFVSSNLDSGYTNGVRIAWSTNGWTPLAQRGSQLNPARIVSGVLRVFSLNRLHLERLGVLPDSFSQEECHLTMERDNLQAGACTMRGASLAQTMYTPGDLERETRILDERPYAGFLHATWSVTTLDAPRSRNPRHWISYAEVTHSFLAGVTGALAGAEQTQSLAHWSWAASAVRPRGWGNQLESSLQLGAFSEMAVRPYVFEACRRGCSGHRDEGRWADLTPRAELVLSSHMVRASAGLVARLGARFPDNAGTLRIPVGAPAAAPGARVSGCFLGLVCEPYWWNLLATYDQRYVPHNMFISGGYLDHGDDDWGAVRGIDARQRIGEYALGVAFGNGSMSARMQWVARDPEFDVRGTAPTRGVHRYAVLGFTIVSNR